jgi:hypothetical protein
MKKFTVPVILFVALTSAFHAHAQPADATTSPVARTKPAPPTLNDEKRAEQQAAAKARFAAMSRQEKAANKGNKQRPAKPSAPAAPTGRK